ncbi:MAG: hypothetical protein AAGB22_15160, partial [Bacteroidota bacterium]
FVFAFLLSALLFSCGTGPDYEHATVASDSAVAEVPTELGPILHDTLAPELVSDIAYIAHTLRHVEPVSQAEWVDQFLREPKPENEIGIWRAIADAFAHYCEAGVTPIQQQAEIYTILLHRSALPVEGVLNALEPVNVPREQMIAIMNTYADTIAPALLPENDPAP